MNYNELFEGLSKNSSNKRVGRWDGSNRWNYCGRGLIWQKSRSGYSKRPGFEGGQKPLHRRLPKLKGFKRYFKFKKDYQVVNLQDIENSANIKDGDKITKETLKQANLIKSTQKPVKILGKGEISKKISLEGIESVSSTVEWKIQS